MLFADELIAPGPVTWPAVVNALVIGLMGALGVWLNWRMSRERQVLTDRVEETERRVRVLRKKHVRSQRHAAEQHAECERRFAQLEGKHEQQIKVERKRAHDYKGLVYALGDKLGVEHDDLAGMINKYIPDATPGRAVAIYLPGFDQMPSETPSPPPPDKPEDRK